MYQPSDVSYEPETLARQAQGYLGSEHEVLAAGVLGLQDSVKALAIGGLFDVDGQDISRNRAKAAAKQGLAVQLLIAVTATTIHVLEFTGAVPTKQFMEFDRATCRVKVIWFGLSRRIRLESADKQQKLRLTGSIAPFSAVSAGCKALLAVLAPKE